MSHSLIFFRNADYSLATTAHNVQYQILGPIMVVLNHTWPLRMKKQIWPCQAGEGEEGY